MAEKAAGKKKQQPQQQKQQQPQNQQQQQQQQKNKKPKQPEKKKPQKNEVKPKKILVNSNQQSYTNQKKKFKGNENSVSNNHFNKPSKKKSGSNGRSFLWVFGTRVTYILLFLGFIYVVDYDKFARIRDGASYYVNQTLSLLPPEVLTKGKQVVESMQPIAEVTVNKANVFIKEASSFLNTNPLVKDHWTNIRDISSICSARLVDYMRTLYTQTTGYCNNIKNKLFN